MKNSFKRFNLKNIWKWLKFTIPISFVLSFSYIVALIFLPFFKALKIILMIALFFILEFLLRGEFKKIKRIFYAGSVVAFTVIICTLSFKTYYKVTLTSKGAKMFYPEIYKDVKDHFQERYGMEFEVTGVAYYLTGNISLGYDWLKSAKGYLVDDPKAGVGVWFYNGNIHDDYGRTIFRNKVIKYYEDLLKDIIPWEFKIHMNVNGIYTDHYKKSYGEVLENKDTGIIAWLNFFIVSSDEVLKNHSQEECQDVFFKIANTIYSKISYIKKGNHIGMYFLDATPEEIKQFPGTYLFNRKDLNSYRLFVNTENLDEEFFKLKNFKGFQKYMKDKNREVEKWR